MRKKTLLFLLASFGVFGMAACGSVVESSNSIIPPSSSAESSSITPSSSSEVHQHTFRDVAAVNATCTNPGSIAYKVCTGCEKLFNLEGQEITQADTIVAALGHDYGDWTVKTPATCTVDGEEQRVCSRDASHVETRVLSATGHAYGDWTVKTPATCTTAGEEQRVCSHDSSHVETRVLPALGHDYGDWKVTTPATCTTDGEEQRVCSHDSSHVETRVVSATGHDYGNWQITKQPTCEEAGEEKRVCSHDESHVEVRDYGEPTGHSYGVWSTTTEPTCTTSGIQTRVCANDSSHKETRVLDALGHDLVLDQDNPFTWDGTSAKANLVCQRANCDHTEQVPAQMSISVQSSKNCENAQKIKYTATYQGTSDFKIVDGEPATGHHYEFVGFIWNDSNKTAQAKYVCANDGSHVQLFDAEMSEGVLKTAATCENDAVYTYTASYDSHNESRDYAMADTALGHEYDFAGYVWAVDHTTAQAKYVCSHDNNHVIFENAVVTSKVIPSTCIKLDETEYTASYGTEEPEVQKITTGDVKGGHDYEFKGFIWNGTTAKVSLVCKTESSHTFQMIAEVSSVQKTPATCYSKEVRTFTATYQDGEVIRQDSKDIEVGELLPHNLEASFQWNPNYSTAVISLDCQNDGCTHHEEYNADVTSLVTQQQTCEKEEKTTFTATYGDYKDVQIVDTKAASGHDYQFSRIVWGEENSVVSAKAELICHNDNNHKTFADVSITYVDTEPTCVAAGYRTYTAEYIVNEVKYSGTYVVAGDPATGDHTPDTPAHENVQAATCTEAGSYDEVTYCSVCKTHVIKSEHKIVPATGHNFVFDKKIDPTCTKDGYDLYKCSACDDDIEEHRNPVSATGHVWDHDRDCTHGHTCSVCHVEEPALGHDFQLVNKTNATCTEVETSHYKCSRCEETKDVVTGPALGHHYDDEEGHVKEVLQEGETCIYDKVYTCTNGCGTKVTNGTVAHHDYVARITTEANCQNKGVKTYECSVCHHSYPKDIPVDANNHVWQLGTPVDGVRTDTCSVSGCDATRQVTIFTGSANAEGLKGKEIAVSNDEDKVDASMKIDDKIIDNLVDNLGENATLKLNIAKVDVDKITGITPEQKAQIGDNTVYDFSMTMTSGDQDQPVDFGKDNYVTVTIPYPATKVTNADSIAVWFINDSGQVESIKATYANGYITFKTNHFSKYTVTRLSPEEFCGLYGHSLNRLQEVEGDCTHSAYTVDVCARCHEKIVKITKPAPGHNWTLISSSSTDPTCTTSGLKSYECSVCHETKQENVAAIGHEWVFNGYQWGGDYSTAKALFICNHDKNHTELRDAKVTTKEIEPTCTAWGYTVVTAQYGEQEPVSTSVNYVEPLGHNPGEVHNENVVKPTCTEIGYHDEVVRCTRCNEVLSTEVKKQDDALGHKWGEWALYGEDATCTVDGVERRYCENDDKHYEERIRYATGHTPGEAVIENNVDPTCTEPGHYESVISCSVCGNELSRETINVPATGHDWGEWVITTEATCQHAGEEQRKCNNDNEHVETRVIPQTDHVAGEPARENVEEATCTTDGHYDEVIRCIYCNEVLSHDDDITIPALGHDYKVTFVLNDDPNTATASFVCSRDEEHNFSKEVATTVVGDGPTCSEARDVHYAASITYNGVTYNAEPELIKEDYILEHVPGEAVIENEVEATCEHRGGYDEVVYCEVCHEKLDEEHHDIPALPHTSAAPVIENEVAASCTQAGGYDEVKYCVECGKELERNHVIIPKLDHVVSELLSDEDMHFHMCTACGQVLDYEEHAYVNTVTKEATCSVNGVYHHVCEECGFEYDTSIPKTGIHNYVNGVCSMCGKVEKTCDHTELHDKTLSISDVGGCGGYITYKTCECGEVKFIDEYHFEPQCNIYAVQPRMEEREYEGKVVQVQIMTCQDCGMEYHMYNTGSEKDGCTNIVNYPFRIFDPEGEIVLDAIYHYESTYHNHTAFKSFALDEAGNYLAYEYCEDCQKIIRIRGVVISRDDVETINSKQVVDDNKVIETITYSYDDVIVEIAKETVTDGCTITTTNMATVYIDNAVVFEFISEPKQEETHKWKYTYEMMDEEKGCSGGVKMTRECEKCGIAQHGVTYGHSNYEQAVIDFTELSGGTCKGSFEYSTCSVCDEVASFNLMELMNSKIHNYDSNYGTPDENGNMTMTLVCKDCGFTVTGVASTHVDGCVTEMRFTGTAYYDAENPLLVINDYLVQRREDHNYVVKNVEFLDPEKGCEGGAIVSYQCDKCGDSYESRSYGHSYKDKDQSGTIYDDMTKNSLATYHKSTCDICGKDVVHNLEVNYGAFESSVEHQETIDGKDYKGYILTSPDGTLQAKVLAANFKISSCEEANNRYIELLMKNEEGVFASFMVKVDSYTSSSHQWEYNVEFLDPEKGCEGGYEGVKVCSVCHEEEQISGSWHQERTHQTIDLSEYGACQGNLIEIEKCNICGEVFEEYYKEGPCNFKESGEPYYYPDHDEKNGHSHYKRTLVCSKCGLQLEYIVDNINAKESCYYLDSHQTIISIGEFKYTLSDSHEGYSHYYENESYESRGNCEKDGYIYHAICTKCGQKVDELRYGHRYQEYYEPIGEDCEKDGLLVKVKCIICGESGEKQYVINGHKYEEKKVNLSQYIPNQEGYISYSECKYCGKVQPNNVDCYVPGGLINTSNSYVDKDGYKHDVNVDSGLRNDQDEYLFRDSTDRRYVPVDNCRTSVEVTRQVFVNGSVVYTSVSDEGYVYNHDYEYTFTFDKDENCENGFLVVSKCKNCGDINEEHCDYHRPFIVEKVDFTKYGSTHEGELVIEKCPCGEHHDYYVNSTCDFNNTSIEGGNRYTCAECGFQYEITSSYQYHEEGSCVVDRVVTIKVGTQTEKPYVIDIVYSNYDENHSFQDQDHIFAQRTIDEKEGRYVETETFTCERCGGQEISEYEYVEGDYVDNKWNGGKIVRNLHTYANGSSELNLYTYYYIGEEIYQLLTTRLITESDGSWHRNDYEYSDNDPCHYVETDTDSEGYKYSYEGVRHLHETWIYYEKVSCSQNAVEGYICLVCGEASDKYERALDHDFRYDDQKECYVCSRCGLENDTGVSGSIILEDLSNDEYYVVGYAFNTPVQFSKAVILTPNEGKPLILNSNDIDFNKTDSPRAYSFSKEQISEIAAKNEFKDYDVTFVFYPYGDDSSYQYAISLTK
ncbi:MAG: hypothetical protein E7178_03580 [Erysipelotrichaceae bacterium]|nr:hypothetical protein [Erysipelotrichaceae bacterium]